MAISSLLSEYDSIESISAALVKGEISSHQLAADCHKNISRLQEEYNIFISIQDEQDILEEAKNAFTKDKTTTPLTGIPYALKDIFCVQGTKTSCGSKILDNFIAPYDATAVAKLRRAGALMLGKTNMDEFAMGSSSEHSYYGNVANPWDKTRVTGGSSGGSAAAVAARLVPYALGTDTGGSVRQPAAFCGITGIKPTYGRVSRYGMIAYASSLDQAGVFSLSVEDSAYVLNSISGVDKNDSTCSAREAPDYVEALKEDKQQGVKGLKIGVADEFMMDELDSGMRQLVEDALKLLQQEGAEIVPIKLPNLKYAIPCYYTIGLAEASTNLARYDGVRYGYRSPEANDLYSLYVKSRSEGFGAEVKKRLLLGTYVLTTGYYDAYYLKAQKIRRLIRDDFAKALKEVDVIAGPVSPSPAFKMGAKKDPVSMYLQDIYTVPANLAGLPAMSIPMGFIEDLPVGLQFIGEQFGERELLRAGAVYQELTDWHKKAPSVVDKRS